MSFRSALVVLGMAFSIVMVSCAEKEDPNPKYLKYATENEGCLNEMGPKLEAYFQGNISSADWEKTWDCALDHLALFQQFAVGSTPNGYTKEDIHILISELMVTDQAVSMDLVQAHFWIKSALFGGDSEILTKSELKAFVQLMKKIKAESVALIPYLAKRSRDPSPANLSQLSGAIRTFLQAIAPELRTADNETLTWERLEKFILEFSHLQKWELPGDWIEWVKFSKGFFLAGSNQGIAGKDWPKFFWLISELTEPLLFLSHLDLNQMNGPNEKFEYYLKIARLLDPTIQSVFAVHGGALHYRWFERLLDLVPSEALSTAKGRPISRNILTGALRTALQKLFGASKTRGITPEAFQKMVRTLEKWSSRQRVIELAFNAAGKSSDRMGKVELLAILRQLSEQESETRPTDSVSKASYQDWEDWIQRFRPILPDNTVVMRFVYQSDWTLHGLSQLNLNRTIAEGVMEGYGVTQSNGAKKAGFLQAQALVDDFKVLLADLQFIDPTVNDLADRRFREATLFTYASDGDEWIDLDEFTYYLFFLNSIGQHARNQLAVYEGICELKGSESGVDHYGWKWMDPDCFRREYFENHAEVWSFAPGMDDFWESLNLQQKSGIIGSIEKAARKFQVSQRPIATYDFEGYSGVIHYVETLFQRYDRDLNQALDLDEVMLAFPVFRRELANFGKIDFEDRAMLEAIFTYVVHYGRAPDPSTTYGAIHFVTWLAGRPMWVIRADRAAIFKVFGVLSTPVQ